MKVFWASLGAFAIFYYIGRRERLKELQGLWSDYVRGEWWINEDGSSDYADVLTGDAGHEQIAIERMIDEDSIRDALLNELDSGKRDDDTNRKMIHLLDYLRPTRRYDDSNVFEILSKLVDVPESVGIKATGSKDAWNDLKNDPRFAYMRHQNAIRVINNQFQAWKVTPKTIRAIQNFLYEQSAGDDAPEGDTEVCVEEVGTRKYACKPVSEFLTIKMPGKLWR